MDEQLSFFPPETDKEKTELALVNIRKFLNAERKMREWVFRNKPDVREKKLREIDGAAKSVGIIEGILHKAKIIG